MKKIISIIGATLIFTLSIILFQNFERQSRSVSGYGISDCKAILDSSSAVNPTPFVKDELSFVEVSYLSGLENHSVSEYDRVSVGDLNGDGKIDFILNQNIFLNESQSDEIIFRPGNIEMDFKPHARSKQMIFDMDRDGRMDIISISNGELKVFNNENNKFKNRDILPIPRNVSAMAFADLNMDGYDDLVLGFHEKSADRREPVVLHNLDGKRFEIQPDDIYGFTKGKPYPRSIAIANVLNSSSSHDSNLGLYFSNYRMTANSLFFGTSGDVANDYRFRLAGDGNKEWTYGHSLSSFWSDFNNDGHLDLWVSNLSHAGPQFKASDSSKIYKNNRGIFEDRTSGCNIDKGLNGAKNDDLMIHNMAADFDNDGFVDVVGTQIYDLDYANTIFFKNSGDFVFTKISVLPKMINSSIGAYADFNNDGKIDLILGGQDKRGASGRLRVFKNTSKNGNNYIKVKLVGHEDSSLVGAQVRLFLRKSSISEQGRTTSQRSTLLRQFDGVSGYEGQQNDSILHFGIGKATAIDQIEVLWPNGRVSRIYPNSKFKNGALKVNTSYVITQRN